jgi:hypothetical protein
VACLGVTVGDWRLLALSAAQNMALEVAHKASVRTKDMPFIELLASIKQRREQQMLLDKHDAINAKIDPKSGKMAGAGQYADGALKDGQLSLPRDAVYLAEILAHQGAFQDAGKAFNKVGRHSSSWAFALYSFDAI